MQLNRIDQVAFAVEDLDAAIALWEGAFGATLEYREVVDSDLIEEAMLKVGDGYIQLITPTSDDSTVARFLKRNGPGLHHVGFAVPSVADALDDLRASGVRLVAFVHPKGTGGVLVELVEDEHAPAPAPTQSAGPAPTQSAGPAPTGPHH